MSSYLAPTLNDVAQKAGVSTATVSRCLNTPGRVSKHTRDKVEHAINALGYIPNFGARVMASKRTYTIGAIIPTMENAIFARGIQSFQDELHKQGYTLLVASSSYDPKMEEQQIRNLVSRGADGLLLIGHDRDPRILDFLEAHNIPVLIAWAHELKARLPSIGFDNFKAMAKLTKHILSLGHKNIGMISAKTRNNDRARARLNAIRHVMLEAGISPNKLALVETTFGIETGALAFAKIWKLSPQPTVIICGNDVLAAGALKEAKSLGVSTPEDVSVTGFDDIEIARILSPELTTVHVPHRQMGTKAAQILIDFLRGLPPKQTTELEVTLKLRESLDIPKHLTEHN